MKEYTHIIHTFDPIYNKNSKILILGTLPSVKSRENAFYYSHRQNRFWKVLANIFDADIPESIEQKKRLLLENNISLWDVIAECDIIGSSDSSIKNVVPTDLSRIFDTAPIERIYANGGTAKRLYDKYQREIYQREIILLPSTSPANAAWSFEQLTDEWGRLIKICTHRPTT